MGVHELQCQAEEGPGTAALRLGHTIQVYDLAEDDRWPAYSEVALAAGIRSVLSVPIALEPGAQAVLNCYAEEPATLDAGVSAGAENFAEVASSPLRLTLMMEAERERAADLKAALDSRTAINLATGVVMAQSGCSQEQAVDVLRRASVNQNSKLRHVASQILARFGEECPATHFD
ncbi:GAF and ANTAR domain-containing protein [Sinomonas atrocyanea]